MKVREIHLKTIPVLNPFTLEQEKDQTGKLLWFNYREQLWLLLRDPSDTQGITTEQMMDRARMRFLLEDAKDDESLFLTEPQYAILNEVIETVRWVRVDGNAAKLIDAIRNAPEVEVGKKEK